MKKVLVIGSANVDMIVKVPVLPVKGETVLGGDFYKLPGGKGANQAVAVKRCGADVTFLACVGDDSFGREAIFGYQEDGINTSAIQEIADVSTGVALITVDAQGSNTISVASGANYCLDEAVIKANRLLIQSSDYLLIQLETPIDAVVAAIDIAQQSDTTVVLNPAPAQQLPEALFAKIDLLTPNETEAEHLTGIAVTDMASVEKAAQALLDKGVGRVVITLGEKGVFCADAASAKHYPCFIVNAIDTTAAGDTFNGALVAALARGEAFEEALQFAQAASALSVSKIGAQSAIPFMEDVFEKLGSFSA